MTLNGPHKAEHTSPDAIKLHKVWILDVVRTFPSVSGLEETPKDGSATAVLSHSLVNTVESRHLHHWWAGSCPYRHIIGATSVLWHGQSSCVPQHPPHQVRGVRSTPLWPPGRPCPFAQRLRLHNFSFHVLANIRCLEQPLHVPSQCDLSFVRALPTGPLLGSVCHQCMHHRSSALD
jgi:hypothetical protein